MTAGHVINTFKLFSGVPASASSSLQHPRTGVQACARPLVDMQRLLLGEHLITSREQFQAPYSLVLLQGCVLHRPSADSLSDCPTGTFKQLCQCTTARDPNIAQSQASRLAISNLGPAPK